MQYLAGVSRYHSYLNSTVTILFLYKGEELFPFFVKKYFSGNKKFGSTDRKQISHLCYCYFRLGKALPAVAVEERIITALFLCSNEPNKELEALKPEWNQKSTLSVRDKISFLGLTVLINEIFPWNDELSDGINAEEFPVSFLQQPDLFLRIRPGHAEDVLLKLNATRVDYEFISPFTLRLPNSFKADQHFELDKEVVVQDYNSQQVRFFLQNLKSHHSEGDKGYKFSLWDCCAASGGKSIMAKDILGDIELTVSDVRESILLNLKKRFSIAGIDKYKSFLLDLTKDNFQNLIISNPRLTDSFGQEYSMIIADVPCTGSGTWGRTPEQLYYFEDRKIEEYASLQKKIVSNVIPHLAPGGYLLYITCSIFKKENEEAIDFIKEKFRLQLVKMELLKGYDKKADTMFAALLKKPL